MTNDQLEAELREVFSRRAAEVPAQVVERLCRVDYKPRTRRRWPLTVSAVGAASGTAAVVSVVVLGGSQAAFAGWSATPTSPTDTQSAATEDNCQGRLSTLPGGTDQGSWSQVANDVRGPYTVAIYENASSFATCFTGPSFTVTSINSTTSKGGGMMVSGSSSGTGSGRASTSTGIQSPGGGIEQLVVSHLSLTGSGPYTLVEGHSEPTVSAVTLVLSDGQDVTATTGSGWFVAWWPGSKDVTSAKITSASGTTTVPVSVPSQAPAGPTASTGSGAGGSQSGSNTQSGSSTQSGSNTPSGSKGGAVGGPSTNEGGSGSGGVMGPSTHSQGSGGNAPPPPPLPGAGS
jgi:hypothetical protein